MKADHLEEALLVQTFLSVIDLFAHYLKQFDDGGVLLLKLFVPEMRSHLGHLRHGGR